MTAQQRLDLAAGRLLAAARHARARAGDDPLSGWLHLASQMRLASGQLSHTPADAEGGPPASAAECARQALAHLDGLGPLDGPDVPLWAQLIHELACDAAELEDQARDAEP